MDIVATAVFAVSCAACLLVFVNPVIIWFMCLFAKNRGGDPSADSLPAVDFIVVVRNGEDVIEKKITDTLALDYPPDRLRLVVYSDGSTDRTGEIANSLAGERVCPYVDTVHAGKNRSLNKAVAKCSADILVFSDADTDLSGDALRRLVGHFADPEVGGVCGNKVIRGEERGLGEAQVHYARFANCIKSLESRAGSVTTNDGTLYGIRRGLYEEMPPAVTDDLYVCLSIIARGARFLFEPSARAFILPPSRSHRHEISRRRRIVSSSLRGLWLKRQVLNPLRYGVAAVSLLCNKVLRRLLPLFLLGLLFSSAALSPRHPFFTLLFAAQAAFYASALLAGAGGPAGRLGSLARYFVIGNVGTLLGLIDFLRGRAITRWDPE